MITATATLVTGSRMNYTGTIVTNGMILTNDYI